MDKRQHEGVWGNVYIVFVPISTVEAVMIDEYRFILIVELEYLVDRIQHICYPILCRGDYERRHTRACQEI